MATKKAAKYSVYVSVSIDGPKVSGLEMEGTQTFESLTDALSFMEDITEGND